MTMNRRDNKGISYVCRLLFACLIACTGLAGLFAQAPLERAAKPPVDLGQKAIRRMISGKSLVVHAFGFQPFARPLVFTDDLWNGGAGNWNATTWSLGSMPGSLNNAVITNSGGLVQLNVTDTIGNLTIGSANLLNFQNSQSLTITGTTITNSNSTGSGGITLSAGGNLTNLIIGGNVTLTGGGTVTLSNSVNNRIYGAVGTDVLTNANNLIQGSGQIGAGQMGLINQATIDANQATALTIQTTSGTTNTGTLEATAGANLILDGDTYTNAGGTILASGTNSAVTLESPTINGGTLNTASGGVIAALGNPTLNGVTNKGTYQVPNSQNTTIEGIITNTSTAIIQLNAGGNNTNLILGGASVTLTGGGTVTLDNSPNNRIYGAVGTDVLTNVNNLIQGSAQPGGHRCQSGHGAHHRDEYRNHQHRHTGGHRRRQSDPRRRHLHQCRRHDSGFRNQLRGDAAKPNHQRRHAEHGQRRCNCGFRQPYAQRRYQPGHVSIAQRPRHHAGRRHHQHGDHSAKRRRQLYGTDCQRRGDAHRRRCDYAVRQPKQLPAWLRQFDD